MKLRIRWPRAARFLLAGTLVLLAIRVAPNLLQPPAPPKLPSDVGLLRVVQKPAESPPRPDPAQLQPSLGRVVRGGGPRRSAEAA